MNDNALTRYRALECLSYDASTGAFMWIAGKRKGQAAGCLNGVSGYVQISIDGVSYKAHRIAWLIEHGEWPAAMIDHVNGVRNDNRIENLRAATAKTNSENRRFPSSGTAAEKLGVTFRNKKWQARITIDSVVCHIGTFDTCDEAFDAYLAVKRRVHEGCTL